MHKCPCAVNPFAATSKVTKYPYAIMFLCPTVRVAEISLCQNVKRKKYQCTEMCTGQKTHVPRSPWCQNTCAEMSLTEMVGVKISLSQYHENKKMYT